jgi:xylulokinase
MTDKTPNSDKYILAIDHGTSGVKIALVTPRGGIVAFESEATPLIFTPDGGVEQDPDAWWAALVAATQRLIGKGHVPVDDIVAVCCSSTFSSTVVIDANGRPLMNALTWLDARGADCVQRAMKGLINYQGYSLWKILRWLPRTGGAPAVSGKDDMGHLLYIKNNHPEIYEKAHQFLGSKDYLNMRLTGKCAASFDSIMLFWVTDTRDINNVRYDDSLIKALRIDKNKLPPLLRSTDVLGPLSPDAARQLGLGADVKVIVGAADLQSACVGSGAVRDFEGHVYIGTSSWILCHVPFKKTDVLHTIASLPSAIPGKYFCANKQDVAGGALTFLVENLLYHENELRTGAPPPDVYDKIDALAARVPPGAGGVIFTPWLNGEKTPVEDHTVRGGFHNISLTTNMDHLIRAVLEGVAFNSRWTLQYVEKFIGRRMDPLNIIGGGARSGAWCRIFADVLGRAIRRVKDPLQANARGAAFIASVALGFISFNDIPDLIEISDTFEPDETNRALYDALFHEYLSIYKNNKAMYRRLNAR